jgi:hypothetical protein
MDWLGIRTLVWQYGHLPLPPAVASGVLIGFPQPGQKNSIAIKSRFG